MRARITPDPKTTGWYALAEMEFTIDERGHITAGIITETIQYHQGPWPTVENIPGSDKEILDKVTARVPGRYKTVMNVTNLLQKLGTFNPPSNQK